MKYFVVAHVYPDHTEASILTRQELEEKSWAPPCNGTNPLLRLDCGDFLLEIHGFQRLNEARRFKREVCS